MDTEHAEHDDSDSDPVHVRVILGRGGQPGKGSGQDVPRSRPPALAHAGCPFAAAAGGGPPAGGGAANTSSSSSSMVTPYSAVKVLISSAYFSSRRRISRNFGPATITHSRMAAVSSGRTCG